jgi:hydrogenase maturation protease
MRVLVVGCGNPDAGDDAVGVLAVHGARPSLEALADVRVVEGAVGPDLLDLLAECDAAVVVDAIRTPTGERPPGTVVRIEAGPDGLPAEAGRSLSSHGFGVGAAVALARALEHAPSLVFFGVEVSGTEVGTTLSPPVARTLPDLIRRVLDETARLAGAA